MRWAAAPALKSLYRPPPELLETRPRYLLDCVTVNLHSQKHVVSMSSKREHSCMQDGDHVLSGRNVLKIAAGTGAAVVPNRDLLSDTS